MTSRLTSAIHLALLDARPRGLTAQGVTAYVHRAIPGTRHATVSTELARLVAIGAVTQFRKPHLPARYKYRYKIRS